MYLLKEVRKTGNLLLSKILIILILNLRNLLHCYKYIVIFTFVYTTLIHLI